MDKSAPPQRRLLAVLVLLASAGLVHAAATPQELLRDALTARAAGRTVEAIRLLTELKTLTPGDPRLDSLLASLAPAPASKSKTGVPHVPVSSSAITGPPPPVPFGPSVLSVPSGSLPLSSNLKSEIPNKSSLLQAALTAQADGKPEQALAYLRELQNLSPDDPRLSSVVSSLTPKETPRQGAANSASPSKSPQAQPDSSPVSPSEPSLARDTAKGGPKGSEANQNSNLKSEIPASPGPYYVLPESLVLGVVTWVDPTNKQAVVRLYGTWKPDRLYLLSRDVSFEASAVLETSPFHNSRAIGVRAIEGMPQIGQEVIAPGPSVLKRIQEILGPRFRGTPPPPVVKTTDPAAPVETAAPAAPDSEGTLNPDLKPF